ncbi:hypothetical protein MC7420_4405 [Coleofasciculus chthonoplastes PCC 7420]|uniref:Uncharacterized protein n=1 Tax=Coleofasciculus chthonoplastes PCC 7420 TaxID=118168 RepID=B4VXZ4_9CYAN|nr:hypothetical protein MC7420_4405 [Coleofasciculus chthonoplastes PCC 7420]
MGEMGEMRKMRKDFSNATDFRVCSKRFSASGTLRAYYEPSLSQ